MTLHNVSGQLKATPPFDFARSLDYLRWFRPMAMEGAVTDNSFRKAFLVAGQAVLCEVSGAKDQGASGVDYRLWSARPLSEEQVRAAAARLGDFLSLADDLNPFYARAEGDPVFASIIAALHGYHQVKFPSPFECAVWAILSQRNRMTTARNMLQELTHRFGHPIELEGDTYWAFPEARELADCEEGDLAFVARNLRRGEFLIDAARAFAFLPTEVLAAMDYDEAESWLLDIKGIGPWSSRFILLRGLGRYEKVPAEDRAIATAASRLYGAGRTVTPREIQRWAARYGPWQGYWAHYLRLAA